MEKSNEQFHFFKKNKTGKKYLGLGSIMEFDKL